MIRKCIMCKKELKSTTTGSFCSAKCHDKAMKRQDFVRRTNKDAQLYYRFYRLEMERLDWSQKEF